MTDSCLKQLAARPDISSRICTRSCKAGIGCGRPCQQDTCRSGWFKGKLGHQFNLIQCMS